MGLPPTDSASGPSTSTKGKPPPVARRRVRSESDRKKHAGWRQCPRCTRSVSTNGRNYYHHMHKCDPVFFADLIARFDATRSSKPPPPLPPSPTVPSVSLSPTTPPPPPSLHNTDTNANTNTHANANANASSNANVNASAGASAGASASASLPYPHTATQSTKHLRLRLSDMQRSVFLQQLCFLRVYDRTVDTVFRQLEATHTRAFAASIFEAVRRAKSLQQSAAVSYTPPYTPPNTSAPPRSYAPVPLPDTIASPLTANAVSPLPLHSPDPSCSQPVTANIPVQQALPFQFPKHPSDQVPRERHSVSDPMLSSTPTATYPAFGPGTFMSNPLSTSAQMHALIHPMDIRTFSNVAPPPLSHSQPTSHSTPPTSRHISAMSISSVINN